jgi:hypothetical protein
MAIQGILCGQAILTPLRADTLSTGRAGELAAFPISSQ